MDSLDGLLPAACCRPGGLARAGRGLWDKWPLGPKIMDFPRNPHGKMVERRQTRWRPLSAEIVLRNARNASPPEELGAAGDARPVPGPRTCPPRFVARRTAHPKDVPARLPVGRCSGSAGSPRDARTASEPRLFRGRRLPRFARAGPQGRRGAVAEAPSTLPRRRADRVVGLRRRGRRRRRARGCRRLRVLRAAAAARHGGDAEEEAEAAAEAARRPCPGVPREPVQPIDAAHFGSL
jgi:hypothetical protein